MPNLPTGPASRLLPALRRVVLVRESADRTDGQLLTAFLRERDADAFAVLVRRHGPMVLGVARRVIGDLHTADDAFQAVFLVLARRASAVRPREQVGNWLYGVAYRTAMKARAVLARRRSREKQVDAMPEPPAHATPDSWSDLQPVIDAELARLPVKLRLPVVLCDLEGRPQRAVAKHLGIAPATLAARVAAARRLLAERLGKRGISLSGGALAVVLGERASAAMVAPVLAESTVRAAEALAAGAATSGLSGLVSAHAIHLCEGVMRMMLLTKLKTAGIATLVAFALAGSVGFGLTPAKAGDEPKTAQASPGRQPGEPLPKAPESIDDATFLRRLTLDLTGQVPSRIEMGYFTTDADAKKRAKVIDWLIADESVKAALAKKLGVPPEQLKILRAVDEKGNVYKIAMAVDRKVKAARLKSAAFSPDGNVLAVDLDRENNPKVTVIETGTFLSNTLDIDGRVELTWAVPQRVNVNQIWGHFFAATDPPVEQFLEFNAPSREGEYRVLIGDGIKVRVPTLAESNAESDAAFLKKAVETARGSAPTPLEAKYFAEDKDPKKREKLLDLLLKDPAVAKKLGDEWKKKMLAPPEATQWSGTSELRLQPYLDLTQSAPTRVVWDYAVTVKAPDKFEKLVGELIAAKKTDEQILEALALAAAGRLPSAEEKKATLAVIGTLADKKAAWVAIAKTFTK